ncbi:uncharacterized protein LOC119730623 [Patiria miniata]|uniref:Uncharacterized protein n=1 Tax=Patiria miniata TaxID=46514 RepID=A0A914A6W2_PATMI|nr:uncharacterized protein LOC119730623 [Patiria miniata]
MQITQANGPANGVVQQQSPAVGYGRRAAKTPHGVPCLLVVSIFHLVLGVLSVGLGVAAIILQCAFYESGWAIWSGTLFFAVTGILGIIAACINRNKCLIIAFLVMSILSSVVAGLLLLEAAIGASLEIHDPSCTKQYYWHDGHYDSEYCVSSWQSRLAVDVVIAVVALADLIFSIVGSALCCYGLAKFVPTNTSATEMQVRYVPQQQQLRQTVTQFVPVINTQQPRQQQPYQMQAAPAAATPVQGGFLVSSPYVGQGLVPTQQVGVATQQIGLPQQHSGRSTPLLDVSQQHSGRSTPQLVYVQQPAVVPVVVPPQPNLVPQLQVGLQREQAIFQQSGVPIQQGGGSQQVEVGSQQVGIDSQLVGIGFQQEGVGSEQVGIGSQQVGIGSEQGGFGTQQDGIGSYQGSFGSQQVGTGSQQVGIGSDQGVFGSPQVGIGFHPVGIGSPQVGIGSPQEMASQPAGMAADPPATLHGSDERETVQDQEIGELQMGGDEQYRDDKLLLVDTD